MIFSNVSRVQERGFELDPAALERIGVSDRSVCWGVWVPDPRVNANRRRHLLISPIHPSVWPFLVRMEIQLCDKPGKMAIAAKELADAHLNIQFAESASSGHHHATWNVVAEANDIRSALLKDFTEIRKLTDDDRTYMNHKLGKFSNQLAALMLAKAVKLPTTLEDAHRRNESYVAGKLDCGFLHNRIVDKDLIRFFYEPTAMPPELVEVAKKGRPQAVTCRWMQNLAFFAIYGDMRQPMRLQYDQATRLLKLSDDSHSLDRILKRQGQQTVLPARAVTSYDTAGLFLRVDIIEPTEARSHFLKATIDYEIEYAPDAPPGADDTALGLWLSVCEQVALHRINLVRISSRTTHRDDQSEDGAFTLIGRTDTPITDDVVEQLSRSLERECHPKTKNAQCIVTPKTHRFHSYTVFVSRRNSMPMFDEIDVILKKLAEIWGFELEFVKDGVGKPLDQEIARKLRASDGFLQIVSYSVPERDSASHERSVLPDLQWLIHEYGLAVGAGKPHARIFDVTSRPFSEWMHIVSPGGSEGALKYKIKENLEEVRTSLDRAFSALAHDIDDGRRGRVHNPS